MWPVMRSTCVVLEDYLLRHHGDSALPGKSFSPEHPDQMGSGPLTHSFSLPFRDAVDWTEISIINVTFD